MATKLPIIWTQHLKEEDKETFRQVLLSSSIVVDRFLDILHQMEEDLSRKEISEEHFNNPEWAVREAYYLGQKAQLKKINDLFKWRPHSK